MPNNPPSSTDSRRRFIKTMGKLVIAIPLIPSCTVEEPPQAFANTVLKQLPRSMRRSPKINAWIEVLEDGKVRIFSGKVELGQGIQNAIRQVAADELYMDLDSIEVMLAETELTPNEGYTAGSGSIQNSAMSVRYAAAAAREKLLALAAQKLSVDTSQLRLDNGFIKIAGSRKRLSFMEILDGQQIEEDVPLDLKLKPKSDYQYVGKAIPREDLSQMLKGELLFIHDLTFPGMVHAKVIRPFNYKSELLNFDEASFKAAAEGVLKIVRNGHFLGVITETAYQAEKVVPLLEKHTQWSKPAIFPDQKNLQGYIKDIAEAPEIVKGKDTNIDSKAVSTSLKASYFKPYTMHASLGPACAISMFDGEVLHIWSHSQGIYPMREAIAAMLQMDIDKIHIISALGAGCFGHTVADDAAADAAILAIAFPNKHIRVRWSRTDEHRWEPYGSAMIMALEAGLDSNGKISYWRSNVWSDSHSSRPNKNASTLLPARYLDPPFPLNNRGYLGGGHRNSDPYYDIPQIQVLAHFFDGPCRVSSLRSLGAFANIFTVESFMDELAKKAGQDVIAFRINHLKDPRAVTVLQEVKMMVAKIKLAENEGIGFAFCRYKNNTSYCALAAKTHVDLTQGTVKLQKFWAAVDVGEVINLDGIKNQVEGAVAQAASWTMKEEVQFNQHEITSSDWNSYPTLLYHETPDIEVSIINRPEEPAMGGGEVGTPPVAAAICNAIFQASGKRIYNLPVRLS